MKAKSLFFHLLVRLLCAAPLAKLIKRYFSLNELFVLARPIINTLTIATCQFYEIFLSHVLVASLLVTSYWLLVIHKREKCTTNNRKHKIQRALSTLPHAADLIP